ncbi:PHB depolymerase family esterase [Mycobacterium sp. DL592]|uniref:extracellular catalytic domain type 1 short-chain-length polyhydroxyalkanoate depolymerase n=1 Tax=Mycobacterium sp. DL592 TaxID=2675524 RepID=UPI001423F3A6|nr:PHB depolymerase family esterase [Mycobacterium sp. DL592]
MITRTTAFVAGLIVVAALTAAPASATPGDPPGALTFGGLQRTYVLHVPPGLQQPSGLVINLHGAGQNGAIQAGVTNYNAVADRYGFVVAYPDGIDMSWADGRGASVPDREGVDDVGFLAALIGQLTHDFGIPPGRVFVTGMSAGAFMANRLACDRADLVSAVAPVAGTLGVGVACNPSKPVSVLAIHGTADQVVPFAGGPMVGRGGPSEIVSAPEMAERWRALDQCPSTPAPNPAGFTATGCAGGTQVEFVSVNGAGHTWPMNAGVDASAATGQFFASQA